ncbi:hypothetical protein C8J57DRAFT_1574557 [Mycena rebaudengoi]|nr:hypothetical protein C8J57DRAFT_1574557 [Mycena rebaudengoi]
MRLSFALVFAAILCVDVLATPIITERAPDGTVFLDHLPPITIIDLRALKNATPNVVNTPDKSPANASGKGLGQAPVMLSLDIPQQAKAPANSLENTQGKASAKAPAKNTPSASANASNAPKCKRMDQGTPSTSGQQVSLDPQAPGKQSDQLLDLIDKFVLGTDDIRKDKWLLITHTVGGSEGWVQVETEYAVKKAYKIPMKTRVREVTTYRKDRLMADVVIDTREGNEGVCVVVELKVESSTITGDTFADVVTKDIDKLQSKKLKGEYKGCKTQALAIAWSKDTTTALGALKGQYRMMKYKPADLKVGEGEEEKTISLYEWEPEDKPSSATDPNPFCTS